MKKILCFGYRDWAIEIYNRLADCSRLDVHIFTEKELLTVDLENTLSVVDLNHALLCVEFHFSSQGVAIPYL